MDTLKTLLMGAVGLKVPTEFAQDNYDYKAALHDEMKKLFCDENGRFSNKMYRRNKYDVFDLIGEVIDEELPASVNAALDAFCEVRQYPQGSRPEFYITRGKTRGKQFVTRATEAGDYETFRLDRDSFSVYPQTIGGATYIDFERYLDGVEDLAEQIDVLIEGMLDYIFYMIQDCLLQSWKAAGRPAANKISATSFVISSMVDLINAVRPYGAPVIYCSPEFAMTMTNEIVYKTTGAGAVLPEADKNEIRDRGYIGVFRGTPVVVMPQSYVDETNTKRAINPCFAYVIPAGKEKIVKVCFEGNTEVREDQAVGDWSTIWKMYRKVGVGIVTTPNYWGIYYNSGIDAGGWDEYNTELVGE